jgi:hypothetical protein
MSSSNRRSGDSGSRARHLREVPRLGPSSPEVESRDALETDLDEPDASSWASSEETVVRMTLSDIEELVSQAAAGATVKLPGPSSSDLYESDDDTHPSDVGAAEAPLNQATGEGESADTSLDDLCGGPEDEDRSPEVGGAGPVRTVDEILDDQQARSDVDNTARRQDRAPEDRRGAEAAIEADPFEELALHTPTCEAAPPRAGSASLDGTAVGLSSRSPRPRQETDRVSMRRRSAFRWASLAIIAVLGVTGALIAESKGSAPTARRSAPVSRDTGARTLSITDIRRASEDLVGSIARVEAVGVAVVKDIGRSTKHQARRPARRRVRKRSRGHHSPNSASAPTASSAADSGAAAPTTGSSVSSTPPPAASTSSAGGGTSASAGSSAPTASHPHAYGQGGELGLGHSTDSS